MSDDVFAKPTAFLKPIRRKDTTDEKATENQKDIERESTVEKVVETCDVEKKEEKEGPQYTEVTPELQYTEPKWSGAASYHYSLEVLKGGKIIEEIDISSSAVQTVGRLPTTDVACLHPSISRYHAVFQHKSKDDNTKGAVFLYDLGSSYGTIVNKVKITPHTYYMLRTGYVIKFGASTRLYIVKGPPEEAFDDEKEMLQDPPTNTVTPPTGALCSEEAELFLTKVREREAQVEEEEGSGSGISWGFREDAVDEEYMTLNLEKMAKPAEFKDPKKTLRGYYEREGLDLEYNVTETGQGRSHQYICKVELPLDTPAPVVAEGSSCGKKRDAVLACALHACQLLDGYNVLRSSHSHAVSKTEQLSKNDFYEEEEDTFTDRTGDIERKRKRRMERAGVEEERTSKTFDMLCKELDEVDKQMTKLSTIIKANKVHDVVEGDDELDIYMASVRASTAVDTAALKESKKKLYDLKQDKVRLERLCQLAKPIAMPEVKRLSSVPSNICTGKIGSVSSKRQSTAPTVKTYFPAPTRPLTEPRTSPAVSKTSKKIKIEFSKVFSKPVIDVKDSEEQSAGIPIKEDATEIQSAIKEDATEIRSAIKEDATEIPGNFSTEGDIMEESSKVENNEVESNEVENNEVEGSKEDPMNNEEVSEEETIKLKEEVSEEEETKDAKVSKMGPSCSESTTCSKKRKRPRKGPTLTENIKWDDGQEAEDFINWLPPKNQTGDGRTKLNDKFGY